MYDLSSHLSIVVVRSSTITTSVGKDITIEWSIPPNAINFFIYIGEKQNAQVLATISSGEITYNSKIVAEKFDERLTVEFAKKELKLKLFSVKLKDNGVYTATAQFGIVKSKILNTYHVKVTGIDLDMLKCRLHSLLLPELMENNFGKSFLAKILRRAFIRRIFGF